MDDSFGEQRCDSFVIFNTSREVGVQHFYMGEVKACDRELVRASCLPNWSPQLLEQALVLFGVDALFCDCVRTTDLRP